MAISKYVKFLEGGKGWLVLDDKQISYRHHKGTVPSAIEIFYLFLSDKDARKLIKDYQSKSRKLKYHIQRITGMSGCEDYYIIFAEYFGGRYHELRRKHLLHISMYGKVNEGISMYIGDFVEIISWIQDNTNMLFDDPRRMLFRRSRIKYIKEREANFEYYGTHVSNILV